MNRLLGGDDRLCQRHPSSAIQTQVIRVTRPERAGAVGLVPGGLTWKLILAIYAL